MKIEIEWTSDSYDCDTCGPSWAEGAVVKFDGQEVLALVPVAHCYDGQSYSEREVFAAVLEKLGHQLEAT